MTERPKPNQNPFTDTAPYQAPPLPDVTAQRPGGLTAICIIAIVLGILGIFSSGAKGVNVIFGAKMQKAFSSLGAGGQEQQQAQEDMHNALAGEMERFQVVNAILCVAQLCLCITLALTGLRTLGLKESGRQLMLWACGLLLLYEIGQLVVFVIQQMSIAPIMELYMPRLMTGPDGEATAGAEFGKIIARMSIIVGMVSQCVWTLIKFVFFVVAIRYMRKPRVVALFESPSQSNLPESA